MTDFETCYNCGLERPVGDYQFVLESECQAHEQTKKDLFIANELLGRVAKRLEDLEVALLEALAPSDAKHLDTHVIFTTFGEEGFTEIDQAIKNAKARE